MVTRPFVEEMAVWAKKAAKTYTDSVVLNGVPIKYPAVNPTTQTWQFWNPTIPGYEDTTYTAIGRDGVDGISPHIGANGNWLIGDVDTGVSALNENSVLETKITDAPTWSFGNDEWSNSAKKTVEISAQEGISPSDGGDPEQWLDILIKLQEFVRIHLGNNGYIAIHDDGVAICRNYGRIIAERNGHIVVRDGGRVIAENDGVIKVKDNGRVVVEQDGLVRAATNGKVIAEENGLIKAANNGQIVAEHDGEIFVRNNGTVCVKENALVEARNGIDFRMNGDIRREGEFGFSGIRAMSVDEHGYWRDIMHQGIAGEYTSEKHFNTSGSGGAPNFMYFVVQNINFKRFDSGLYFKVGTDYNGGVMPKEIISFINIHVNGPLRINIDIPMNNSILYLANVSATGGISIYLDNPTQIERLSFENVKGEITIHAFGNSNITQLNLMSAEIREMYGLHITNTLIHNMSKVIMRSCTTDSLNVDNHSEIYLDGDCKVYNNAYVAGLLKLGYSSDNPQIDPAILTKNISTVIFDENGTLDTFVRKTN